MAHGVREARRVLIYVAQQVAELRDVGGEIAMLQGAAKLGAEKRAAESAGAFEAVMAPEIIVRMCASNHVERAHDEQVGDDVRKPVRADVIGALLHVTHRDGAIGKHHRRKPTQHGQRPENESVQAVLREDGRGVFVHALRA